MSDKQKKIYFILFPILILGFDFFFYDSSAFYPKIVENITNIASAVLFAVLSFGITSLFVKGSKILFVITNIVLFISLYFLYGLAYMFSHGW